MNKPKNIDQYSTLVANISNLIKVSKQKLAHSVNRSIILTNWSIGQYIVEYEQGGKTRANYGKELLQNLSKDLTDKLGKGYSYRNLRLFRQFYLVFQNWHTVSANSTEDSIFQLTTQLSWSHFVRLVSIKVEEERQYYIQESIENNWSVRELSRQIDSSLFERQLLSKKQIQSQKSDNDSLNELFKDPYVLEFLNLPNPKEYSESDLESAIIDKLELFLLELGKGFSFVARQKRISSESDHFYIDLVFYNRLLRCHVLIDLKIGKLKHQDIGQMQMYVNYFDREIKTEFENATIGIILCKEKNDFVIEYSLPEENNQIFPKEYQLYLPNKKRLKDLLRQYL